MQPWAGLCYVVLLLLLLVSITVLSCLTYALSCHLHCSHVRSGNDSAVDAKIVELRPYFREDFMTYLQSEYNRITTPPMTEQVSQNQRRPLLISKRGAPSRG